MAVFVLSFLVLVAIVVAMSVGVLMGGKPMKGSCGGMSALGMDTACDICGGDTQKCEEEQKKQNTESGGDTSLAYNAAEKSEKNKR